DRERERERDRAGHSIIPGRLITQTAKVAHKKSFDIQNLSHHNFLI
ncbi:MAG: hypothetical protein RIT41_991, partial [Bacteroidota bacterium]